MNARMNLTPANPPTHTSSLSLESLTQRLRRLNLHGLLAHAEELIGEPWLARVLEIEDSERQCRSLKRRTDNARLGKFKSLADFDYNWPKQLDRTLLEELFTFDFLEQGANIIIVGPNGLGKTMIAKNLVHQAILRGHTARIRQIDVDPQGSSIVSASDDGTVRVWPIDVRTTMFEWVTMCVDWGDGPSPATGPAWTQRQAGFDGVMEEDTRNMAPSGSDLRISPIRRAALSDMVTLSVIDSDS